MYEFIDREQEEREKVRRSLDRESGSANSADLYGYEGGLEYGGARRNKSEKQSSRLRNQNLIRRYTAKREARLAVERNSGDSPSTASPQTESKIDSMRKSGGAPLDASTRDFMESRMGHDFSDVRVHTGTEAESTSIDLNAKAYTIGKDIAFNKGEYQPETNEGKKLIAHELTHTIQQGGIKRKEETPGNKSTVNNTESIQRSPETSPAPVQIQRELTNKQVNKAVQENQAKHDYTDDLIDRLVMISKANVHYRRAKRFGRGQTARGESGIGIDFVHLVASVQRAIGIKETGLLDDSTIAVAIKFERSQKLVREILRTLDNRPTMLESQRIILWFRVENNYYLFRALSIEGRFRGQSPVQIISYLFHRMTTRESLQLRDELLEKGLPPELLAYIVNEIKTGKDVADWLGRLRGNNLNTVLLEIESKRGGGAGRRATAIWLFEMMTRIERDKLSDYFFENGSSRAGSTIAARHAALYTAHRIENSLDGYTSALDSRNIFWNFEKIKSPRWRQITFGYLNERTHALWNERASAAMVEDMSVYYYEKTRKLPGLEKHVPFYWSEFAYGLRNLLMAPAELLFFVSQLIVGGVAGFVSGMIAGVWNLTVGLVIDVVQVIRHLIMLFVYQMSGGRYGSESYHKVMLFFEGLWFMIQNPGTVLSQAWDGFWLELQATRGATLEAFEDGYYWGFAIGKLLVNVLTIIGGIKRLARSMATKSTRLGRMLRARRARILRQQRGRRTQFDGRRDRTPEEERRLLDETRQRQDSRRQRKRERRRRTEEHRQNRARIEAKTREISAAIGQDGAGKLINAMGLDAAISFVRTPNLPLQYLRGFVNAGGGKPIAVAARYFGSNVEVVRVLRSAMASTIDFDALKGLLRLAAKHRWSRDRIEDFLQRLNLPNTDWRKVVKWADNFAKEHAPTYPKTGGNDDYGLGNFAKFKPSFFGFIGKPYFVTKTNIIHYVTRHTFKYFVFLNANIKGINSMWPLGTTQKQVERIVKKVCGRKEIRELVIDTRKGTIPNPIVTVTFEGIAYNVRYNAVLNRITQFNPTINSISGREIKAIGSLIGKWPP